MLFFLLIFQWFGLPLSENITLSSEKWECTLILLFSLFLLVLCYKDWALLLHLPCFLFSSSELVPSISTAKAWKLNRWDIQDCWGGLFAMMFRFFLSFLSDFHSIHKDSCHIASVLWYSVVVTKFYGKMRDFHRNDC